MDNELLAHLLSGKRKKAAPVLNGTTGYAILRSGEKVSLRGLSVGHFDSKQGSIRRSKKGRTSIMPNGYARYCAPAAVGWLGDDPDEVVMYLAKSA